MSAGARPRPGRLRTSAAAVLDFLVEPASAPAEPGAAVATAVPVVAVLGLGPRCGATVIARGLAAEVLSRTAPGAAAQPVLDAPDPAAAAAADTVVLVGSPSVEPALAAAVRESLRGAGTDSLVVLTRRRAGLGCWEGRFDVAVPESPLGARAALSGRRMPGAFARALELLADRIEAGP